MQAAANDGSCVLVDLFLDMFVDVFVDVDRPLLPCREVSFAL